MDEVPFEGGRVAECPRAALDEAAEVPGETGKGMVVSGNGVLDGSGLVGVGGAAIVGIANELGLGIGHSGDRCLGI